MGIDELPHQTSPKGDLIGMFPPEKPKNTYKPKPYEQMSHPGERVQVDVRSVTCRRCLKRRLRSLASGIS